MIAGFSNENSGDGDGLRSDSELLLRISLVRKYRKAEGPSVLVRPSGISSCVPSKVGRI